MKNLMRAVLVVLVCAASAGGEQLKINYPKLILVSTPVPVVLKNLDKVPQNREWVYDLPAGASNLAKGRPVSASDMEPLLGSLELITDGDLAADEGSYVELAGGKQWVQIDLGRSAEIHAILCWHYHLQLRAYKDVVVQISDDPSFAKDVKTIFNSDGENGSGQGAGKDFAYIETRFGKLFDAKGAKARYVRLWSNGNTSNGMNHYVEVQVFGK